MNVPLEELNAWAERVHRVNGNLLRAMDAARRGDAEAAGEYAAMVQRSLNGLRHALVRAGANDPMLEARRELLEQARAAGMPAMEREETPLELLSSPTSQAYARAMREAAELAVAVDKERGWWPDGPAETVCDWADGAEFEAFGPKELR